MLLILGGEKERAINDVCRICHHRGLKWFRLNGEDLPYQTQIGFDPLSGSCSFNTDCGRTIDASAIKAVWYRRHGTYSLLPNLTRAQKVFVKSEFKAAFEGIVNAL